MEEPPKKAKRIVRFNHQIGQYLPVDFIPTKETSTRKLFHNKTGESTLCVEDSGQIDELIRNFGKNYDTDEEKETEVTPSRLLRDFKAANIDIQNEPKDHQNTVSGLQWKDIIEKAQNDFKDKSPTTIFKMIWTEDVILHIADETNIFAKIVIAKYERNGLLKSSPLNNWKATNPNEIYVYLAITLSMKACVKTNIKHYFQCTNKIYDTPYYSKFISEDRFWLLYNLVHIIDNAWFARAAMASTSPSKLNIKHIADSLALSLKIHSKVWHRKTFIKLLHYSIKKLNEICWKGDKSTSFFIFKIKFEKDIVNNILNEYHDGNVDLSDDKKVVGEGKCIVGPKDFRECVVDHLPMIHHKKYKEKCVVCQKNCRHTCPSCKVDLCYPQCYRTYSHIPVSKNFKRQNPQNLSGHIKTICKLRRITRQTVKAKSDSANIASVKEAILSENNKLVSELSNGNISDMVIGDDSKKSDENSKTINVDDRVIDDEDKMVDNSDNGDEAIKLKNAMNC